MQRILRDAGMSVLRKASGDCAVCSVAWPGSAHGRMKPADSAPARNDQWASFPALATQAVSVLSINIATVIGPTPPGTGVRSEEHTSELQSLMRISYAVFCLKKKKHTQHIPSTKTTQQ